MKAYTAAVIWISLAIVVAHALAPPAYLWTEHTISHLAAQGYERAWIMRLGFISFGALVLIATIARVRRSPRAAWPHALVGLYALAVLISGIFSTSPFSPGVAYSHREASIHSVMATLAGIALSAAMLSSALVEQTSRRRRIHLSALVLTMLLSSAFGISASAPGIIQRGLYLVGFAWLVFLEMPTGDQSSHATEPSA